jgi:hypothetical protein
MAAAPSRIYVVSREGDKKRELVRAKSQSQAINHIVRNEFKAEVASQDQILELGPQGVVDATADVDVE